MDLNLYLGLPRYPAFHPSLEDVDSYRFVGSFLEATQESPMASPEPPADTSPAIDGNDSPYSSEGEGYATPYAPILPILPQGDVLYTPPLVSGLPAVQDVYLTPENCISYPPRPPPLLASAVEHCDDSISQQDLNQCPQFRFQRLIESNNRCQHRSFHSSVRYGGERSRSDESPLSDSEQLICDIMSTPLPSSFGKDKGGVEGRQGLEEEAKEKSKSAADFECNVCLDVAKEPVVTSCGHLFCWPCLYLWLHVHSEHMECPLCKGEVIESNITPIYGRGSSETDVETPREDGDLGLKIPPRPHGQRVESFRQRMQLVIPSNFEELYAVTQQHLEDEIRSRPNGENYGLGMLRFSDSSYRYLERMFEVRVDARRMLMEEGNPESGSSTQDAEQTGSGSSISTPRNGAMSLPSEVDAHTWQQINHESIRFHEASHLSRNFGRYFGRIGGRSSGQDGPSAFSINTQNSESDISRAPGTATQASDASSTMAVVEGDIVTAASVERSSAGSSRPQRRRGRSRTSSSIRDDGMRGHKRRR